MAHNEINDARNEWECIHDWARAAHIRAAADDVSTYECNVYRRVMARADREMDRLNARSRRSYSLRQLRSDAVFLVARLLRVQIKHRGAWHMRLPYGQDEYGTSEGARALPIGLD